MHNSRKQRVINEQKIIDEVKYKERNMKNEND